MRQTHPSPFSPRSTHTCITRINLTRLLCLTLRSRPPAAWTSHHLLVQALEWRAARVVGAYASISAKGRDRRKRRPARVPRCDGQVSAMIDALPFRRPIKNHRILPSQTQTGETSIHKLSELTLPLSSHAASVPPSDHRVLIDRLIVILDYVWLHPTRSTRRVHSARRVSCLVSVRTFFRSLSPSRTRSGSRTGSWVGMAYTNSCYRCLRYINIIRLICQCAWRVRRTRV